MKGLDAFNDLTKHIDQLKAEGFSFVMRYLFLKSKFKQRFTYEEALALNKAGIRVGTVWENGNPTNPEYFTVAKAKFDAAGMIQEAKRIQQPKGTPIYIAVDYDARWSDVSDYLGQIFESLKGSDYVPGIYGSGLVCMKATDVFGLKYGWLAQSTGFPGFKEYKSKAQIVQGKVTTWHGIDIDLDECADLDKAGLWTYNAIVKPPVKPPVVLPSLTLKKGDTAANKIDLIKELQRLLKITVDGVFGPKTEAAVMAFQKANNLLPDGVVGPKTWAKLLSV